MRHFEFRRGPELLAAVAVIVLLLADPLGLRLVLGTVIGNANGKCVTDTTNANACTITTPAGTSNAQPCPSPLPANGTSYYCTNTKQPGTCSGTTPNGCTFSQNVNCGTQNNCYTSQPVMSNGAAVNCGGAPDVCTAGVAQ